MAVTPINETQSSGQSQIQLSPDERAMVDEMSAQIDALSQQRIGMIRLLAHLHGVRGGDINYLHGSLIITEKK